MSTTKTDRDKRKEQRLKELQEKKDRLRRLKEKNQSEFSTTKVTQLPIFYASYPFINQFTNRPTHVFNKKKHKIFFLHLKNILVYENKKLVQRILFLTNKVFYIVIYFHTKIELNTHVVMWCRRAESTSRPSATCMTCSRPSRRPPCLLSLRKQTKRMMSHVPLLPNATGAEMMMLMECEFDCSVADANGDCRASESPAYGAGSPIASRHFINLSLLCCCKSTTAFYPAECCCARYCTQGPHHSCTFSFDVTQNELVFESRRFKSIREACRLKKRGRVKEMKKSKRITRVPR